MTAPAQSSRNPFRTRYLIPSPVATGTSSIIMPTPAAPNRPHRHTSVNSGPPGLTEDAPPAYTQTADTHQGEETIEVGPGRPFQQAPQHPQPQQRPLTPEPPVRSQSHAPPVHPQSHHQPRPSSPGSSGGGRSARPGQPRLAIPTETTLTSTSTLTLSRLPPRHPSSSSRQRSHSGPPTLPPRPQATSEFSRDFYAVGPCEEAAEISAVLATSSPQQSISSPSRYRSAQVPPPRSTSIPDDGRPTTKPTPGHPLLRDGKILVYPAKHKCKKCHNTGYKSADPSHPCRKCWILYAKPYRGALTYAPSGGKSPKKYTFQRPLPSFLQPQPAAEPPSSQSKSTGLSHPLARMFLGSAPKSPPSNRLVLELEMPRVGRRRRHCCRRAGRGVIL